MGRFLKFITESIKVSYSVNIDPKVTTQQLITDRLKKLDPELEVSNEYGPDNFWITTSLSKEKIESIVGVTYVVESEPGEK
jgi:hypothetical protein